MSAPEITPLETISIVIGISREVNAPLSEQSVHIRESLASEYKGRLPFKTAARLRTQAYRAAQNVVVHNEIEDRLRLVRTARAGNKS